MKKFLENNAVGLFLAVLAASAVILGLCGWIYLDFRGDENRELMYDAEAEAAAQNLLDSLDAGDVILSYHYARTVRDNAARSGYRDAAHTFMGLAETIRITGITDDMADAVAQYLTDGFEKETVNETGENEVVRSSEPADVAAVRQSDALASAEEIMGQEGFLTMAVRCREGEFLFTCRNAYAVIDEKTSMPVEIGISLPPARAEKRLSAEECEEYAARFLRRYFPAVSAEVVRIAPDGDGNMTVEYRLDGRRVTASVRQDTGKIVRYIAR